MFRALGPGQLLEFRAKAMTRVRAKAMARVRVRLRQWLELGSG